jgi:DNA topoisomerase-3
MTILYICEKPSQARDIARNLGAYTRQESCIEGAGVCVTWCYGHLLEMAWPEHYRADINPWRMEKLPVIPTVWHLEPVEKAKKQLNAIKALLKKTDHVIIATDADREGEVIAREILEQFDFTGKIERLWLSALDDASIKKALANIKDGAATENLYHAGLGRQRADWLIGLNMTMATTCLFRQGSGTLSVGRVQTPTLKLVVDRDRAIANFKPKDFFVLLAQFANANNEPFWTKWQPLETELDADGHCVDRRVADTFAAKVKDQPGVIEAFAETEKKKSPPLCLSLSQLQKLASSQYGFSAKQTLDIAQSLYETHKATTYPRTDCGYLPESQHSEAPAILAALKQQSDSRLLALIPLCDPRLTSPVWNDKKVTAHHGIIPTANSNVALARMSAEEGKLYELICRYYLAQFLSDYRYANRSVTVRCAAETFKASSNTPLQMGWKRAIQQDIAEDFKNADDDHLSTIPALAEGETTPQRDLRLETRQTKPPAPFTEGTLIDAMKTVGKYITDPGLKKVLKETAGIGTEATRASILEVLIKREYLQRHGKQLLSTEKGRALIDLLPPIVTDPGLTARWEQELEAVADGALKLDSFLLRQHEALQTMLDALAAKKAQAPTALMPAAAGTVTHLCAQCQKPLLRRKSQKNNEYFWGCSGYPECKTTLPDNKGQPGVRKTAVIPPKTNGAPQRCPVCHTGHLVLREGRNGQFWSCSSYPHCRHSADVDAAKKAILSSLKRSRSRTRARRIG